MVNYIININVYIYINIPLVQYKPSNLIWIKYFKQRLFMILGQVYNRTVYKACLQNDKLHIICRDRFPWIQNTLNIRLNIQFILSFFLAPSSNAIYLGVYIKWRQCWYQTYILSTRVLLYCFLNWMLSKSVITIRFEYHLTFMNHIQGIHLNLRLQ